MVEAHFECPKNREDDCFDSLVDQICLEPFVDDVPPHPYNGKRVVRIAWDKWTLWWKFVASLNDKTVF